MGVFGILRNDAIQSFTSVDQNPVALRPSGNVAVAALSEPAVDLVSFATETGRILSEGDLANQFLVFQFSGEANGPTVLDMSQMTPSKTGNNEQPDALAVLQLAAFNIGRGEDIDDNTRATLRLDFGKDEASNSPLDTVFWSIAAGLNLYDQTKNNRADAKDIKADFNVAFSRRPIEIPGGLGKLSFEVVKHKEPSWWKKIFSFLQSGTGTALTSAVGFPAITSQALGVVDELLDRLDNNNPEMLFRSRPMTLALTKRARDGFTGGNPNVTVGVLNPGFCLLARGRDYKTIISNKAVYMGEYGIIRPKEMGLEEFLRDPSANPFNDMTYAVIRVGTAETKLNPGLDYR